MNRQIRKYHLHVLFYMYEHCTATWNEIRSSWNVYEYMCLYLIFSSSYIRDTFLVDSYKQLPKILGIRQRNIINFSTRKNDEKILWKDSEAKSISHQEPSIQSRNLFLYCLYLLIILQFTQFPSSRSLFFYLFFKLF